jgi:predicted RNA-binding protein with PIN domain
VTNDVPPIPEALLAPLLDEAASVLRTLGPHEIPGSLRTVAGFDSRGLARGAARRQLLRALNEQDDFRERVVARYLERQEAREVLDAWAPHDALRTVRDSMDATALPVLVSVLFAARPPAWAFALGVACEAGVNESHLRRLDQEAAARASEHAAAVTARRSAEAALAEAERSLHHLEQERRDERRSRRTRDDELAREREAALRAQVELEDALVRARAAEEKAFARAERETERARALERELAAAEAAPPTPVVDTAPLRAAATEARLLAERLDALADERAHPTPPGPASTRGERPVSARPRRNRPPCPPGLVADSPAALDATLRAGGVLLVVDGYNVSKTAWPAATPEEQRTRLLAALAELHLRIRCEIVVAFDGADVRGVPVPRRPGVRVVFSAASEEADDVVVREAAAPPRTVPVVVASSDGAVRRRSEHEGAVAVGAATLLSVLRR